MILLADKLIADEILSAHFTCNLEKCKGACCVKGDSGAPLLPAELAEIGNNLGDIIPFINEQGSEYIQKNGFSITQNNEIETACLPTGECVFVSYEGNVATCGIEKANNARSFGFKKPISCHLYPIRVSAVGEYQALNYHKWDICNAACILGQKTKIKVYQFLKEALIRAFGNEFYNQLSQYDTFVNNKKVK